MTVDIRDQLRNVIREKGFSQAAIAYKAGLDPYKLSMIVNKKRKLEANEMIDLWRNEMFYLWASYELR